MLLRGKWIRLGVGVVVCTALFSLARFSSLPRVRVSLEPVQHRSHLPPASHEGQELAFVFIGSSTCGPSNAPELPDAIAKLKELIANKAAISGRSATFIGIARDGNVRAGLSHLQKYGEFHEISTGRGWLNTELVRYVYDQFPGPAATPQILVLDRFVEQRDGNTSVQDERVVLRKIGTREIADWLDKRGELPLLPPARPINRDQKSKASRLLPGLSD